MQEDLRQFVLRRFIEEKKRIREELREIPKSANESTSKSNARRHHIGRSDD